MKKHVGMISAVTLLFFTTAVYAVTYIFPNYAPCHMKNETVIKPGSKIYLFYSGVTNVRRAIKTSDMLSVYREYPSDFTCETREIGKVRILDQVGEHYFRGEVIEGEVQPDFLAKKGRESCFITSFISASHCQKP